jgi:DNA-binding NarL/FixJ family response regulator
MSSFLRQEEMEQAIQLGANCFIPKPAGLDAFLTTVGVKIKELLETSEEIATKAAAPE